MVVVILPWSPHNDCVNGVSAVNGGLPCLPISEFNGYSYITYSKYFGWTWGDYNKNWGWGTGAVSNSSSVSLFDHHNASVDTWLLSNDNATAFSSNNDFKDPFLGVGTNPISWSCGNIDNTGNGNTDCSVSSTRLFLNKSNWIILENYNGSGTIVEAAQTDSTTHFNNLINALSAEAPNLSSADIKNASMETPLVGSFLTAKKYFSNTLTGSTSPIQDSCQQNFVLLVTDGQPTVDQNGNAYTSSQLANATTGKAYTDLYTQIQGLRSLSYGGNTYDIKTYVLGMGDVLSNPVAVDGLNNMASYGGTSKAYLVNDADSMSNAFQNIVGNIYSIPLRQSNGHITLSYSPAGSNISVYKATFANPSSNIWEGNIIKSQPTISVSDNSQISYDTGSITDFNTGAAQWMKNSTVNGSPRQIIAAVKSSDTSSIIGTAFQWSSLNSYSQNLLLNTGETSDQGNSRLNYIRGDRSNEASSSNPNGFRARGTTVLGDIIDSSPVYVGPSVSGFSDADFPTGTASFNAYAQSLANRRPMIYVGANDGMLHGFDASTLQEVFAFIPNSVFPKLKSLSSQSYAHEFYVDETPLITDILIPGKGWTTELIGFPGLGGTGLFTLDVTSPDSRRSGSDLPYAENNASHILLWELNGQSDSDIGYILNRGQINRSRGGSSVQIGKMANGRWAVITGNGYNSPNNSTGLLVAYLDGQLPSYKKVMILGATGGLSTPTPVDIDYDGIIDYAYAGDLQGNVWRFDLRGSDDSKWQAFKLFQAIDSTKVSPITTAPAVMLHCSQAGLMVFVGTGKYIENTDNNSNYTDNHADYLFGLWDKLDNTAISVSDLATQSYLQGTFQNSNTSNAVAQSLLLTTDNAVDWSQQRGWMLRLYNQYPEPARIIVPPYIDHGIIYFNTISPNVASCQASTSWATSQALQACTGQRPQSPVFDTNYDGSLNSNDQYNLNGTMVNVSGINTQDLGRIVDSSIWINPEAFTCATPPCSSIQTGFNDLIGVNLQTITPHRLSWKEISQ